MRAPRTDARSRPSTAPPPRRAPALPALRGPGAASDDDECPTASISGTLPRRCRAPTCAQPDQPPSPSIGPASSSASSTRSSELEIEATSRDLCESGVFVCTQVLEPIGTECQLTILPDGSPPIAVRGVVRRVVEREDAAIRSAWASSSLRSAKTSSRGFAPSSIAWRATRKRPPSTTADRPGCARFAAARVSWFAAARVSFPAAHGSWLGFSGCARFAARGSRLRVFRLARFVLAPSGRARFARGSRASCVSGCAQFAAARFAAACVPAARILLRAVQFVVGLGPLTGSSGGSASRARYARRRLRRLRALVPAARVSGRAAQFVVGLGPLTGSSGGSRLRALVTLGGRNHRLRALALHCADGAVGLAVAVAALGLAVLAVALGLAMAVALGLAVAWPCRCRWSRPCHWPRPCRWPQPCRCLRVCR